MKLALINVCKKQAELDSKIQNSRERTLADIKLSMMAEIIEWNEECFDTHKTWKKKTHDTAKEMEEFVDILFFIAQQANFEENSSEKNKYLISYVPSSIIYTALALLGAAHRADAASIYRAWIKVAENRYYSMRDLTKIYEMKYKKNLERINGEWQNGD